MTATPKIYAESVRAEANEKAAVLVSMDDETTYGPVFHRLGFGEAVERDLLTDYRVLVLTIDEDSISSAFQKEFAQNGELNIPDAARIVGIYNGLAKRGVHGIDTTTPNAHQPLRRAVAFSRSIKDSKAVQAMLDGYDGVDGARPDSIAGQRIDDTDTGQQTFALQARHVDGTMNVLERNAHIDWLKADTDSGSGNVARILTNARCLSEGVDIPALDAVIFLNSRDSQVDVVQSVGRVMRKSPGKDYGYIVLPIAIPAGQTPEQALNDNRKFKVVWDVLRALRAHDERFEAKIEQIDLNARTSDGPVIATWQTDSDLQHIAESGSLDSTRVPLDMTVLGADWQSAIYAKIVDKVGERDYWENWAKNVADIAGRQITRITGLVDGSQPELREAFTRFVKGLQDNLNPSITEAQAIEMLSQHLITQPVFDALFSGHAFSDNNPVSQVMQRMVDALEDQNLDSETVELTTFYAGVQRAVTGITDAAGRQTTIKRLYEKFFTGAFRNTSERLGIVYTPNEIVDFILHSADQLSRSHFGAGLTDLGVHILDPFTGTGTFIVRLLQSGLITPGDMARKFRYELHANEIVLLAYYVAAVNIEATYNSTQGGEYVPFPGIVLTDTFQSSEDDDRYDDEGIFGDNNQRVKDQNALDIRVIVGNPPYSSGQESANDNNQNLKYPSLDKRIATTYAARSTVQNKNSLYDSYIRAIRWASDRIKDRGMIAYVTNGGFLDGNTAAGLRLTLQNEFTELYIFNLRGNTRTSGEQALKEGGQTFGSGSRATIVISLLVKNPDRISSGTLHYRDIGDYLTREQKLALVEKYQGVDGVPWEQLTPNEHGDWINQRNTTYDTFTPIGDRQHPDTGIFRMFSRGLETGRDAWVYNSSEDAVRENTSRMIDTYNSEIDRWHAAGRPRPVEDFIDTDPRRISWARSLRNALRKDQRLSYSAEAITTSVYRPFNKQHVYFSPLMNHERGQQPKFFPPDTTNHGFYLTGTGALKPFACFAVAEVPDLNFWGSEGGQFFPRYVYDTDQQDGMLVGFDGPTRTDNITATALARYQKLYGQNITADDVFYAVYGLLHSEEYRTEFAADLKKMLPRIPELTDTADFRAFAAAGRALSDLHIGYEKAKLFPVTFSGSLPTDLRVVKMRYGGKPGALDRTTIKITDTLTVTGIPEIAHEYKLGSRSALDWVLERYQVKTDKDSGIINDPNYWGLEHDNPAYIVELIQRIITVSVETVRIVESLPALNYRNPGA